MFEPKLSYPTLTALNLWIFFFALSFMNYEGDGDNNDNAEIVSDRVILMQNRTGSQQFLMMSFQMWRRETLKLFLKRLVIN